MPSADTEAFAAADAAHADPSDADTDTDPDTETGPGTSASFHDEDATKLSPGDPGHARMRLALFAAGLATFALLYSTQALRPEISRDLHADPGSASWTVSGATIGLALAVLPLAALSERFGRRRMLTVSMSVAVALALAVPLAPDLGTLIALRTLQGAAIAGALVGALEAAERLPPGLPPSAALLLRFDADKDGLITRTAVLTVTQPAITFDANVCTVPIDDTDSLLLAPGVYYHELYTIEEGVRLDKMGDEPPGEGLLGREHAARRDPLHGAADADHAGQEPAAAGLGHDAAAREHEADPRPACGNADVHGECHRGADADGGPVDGGDDGLLRLEDAERDAAAAVAVCVDGLLAAVVEGVAAAAEVRAGAEGAAGAGHDHDAARRVVAQLGERRAELGQHRIGERVAAVGTVQRDGDDGAITRDGDVFPHDGRTLAHGSEGRNRAAVPSSTKSASPSTRTCPASRTAAA